MRTILLLIFTLLTISLSTAQVVLKIDDLKKVDENHFTESKYYKTFNATPKKGPLCRSWPFIDESTYCFTEYKFNNVASFAFGHQYPLPSDMLLEIHINKKNKFFITEDSIKVGDVVLLSKLMVDIDKEKADLIKKKQKYLYSVYHNQVIYDIKNIRAKRLNAKTKVKIKKIEIKFHDKKY